MVSDGTAKYDHAKDGGDAKLAGCNVDFRGRNSWARIVYQEGLLRMYTDTKDNGWEECFVIRNVKVIKTSHSL